MLLVCFLRTESDFYLRFTYIYFKKVILVCFALMWAFVCVCGGGGGGGGVSVHRIKLYLQVHQRCKCKNMSACVSEKAITSHKDKITSSMASSPSAPRNCYANCYYAHCWQHPVSSRSSSVEDSSLYLSPPSLSPLPLSPPPPPPAAPPFSLPLSLPPSPLSPLSVSVSDSPCLSLSSDLQLRSPWLVPMPSVALAVVEMRHWKRGLPRGSYGSVGGSVWALPCWTCDVD